jgi:hypothetical protein
MFKFGTTLYKVVKRRLSLRQTEGFNLKRVRDTSLQDIKLVLVTLLIITN